MECRSDERPSYERTAMSDEGISADDRRNSVPSAGPSSPPAKLCLAGIRYCTALSSPEQVSTLLGKQSGRKTPFRVGGCHRHHRACGIEILRRTIHAPVTTTPPTRGQAWNVSNTSMSDRT